MKKKLTFVLLSMLTLESQAQLLPSTPLTDRLEQPLGVPVTDRLTTLERQVLYQSRQQLLKDKLATEELRQRLSHSLDPIVQLPASLPVVNKQNQVLWREIELEPGVRVVEGQWLLALSPQQWQQQTLLHPYLVDQQSYPELDLFFYRIQLPVGSRATTELLHSLPDAIKAQMSSNSIYSPQQGRSDTVTAAPSNSACQSQVRIGMVDSAVDQQHQAFTHSDSLISKNFLPADLDQSHQHGTAVASLLVGRGPGLKALLPQAQLLSAAVFYQQNTYQQSATLVHLLEALNWLASQQVQLINLSLTGPAHPLLQQAVKALDKKNVVLIAAAGNAGPAAAPLYPAAYPQVIAVTAVDQHQHIYRWANQGDYIEFAAPGVAVTVAKAGAGFGLETGTSLASPVVAAIAACQLASGVTATQLRTQLQQQAVDLGEPGKDTVYGFGLLRPGSH
ncbi:S8 family serine peptidase [Rheinheimera soli]|uniref:Peptidase S8/S53 domain-containing protein n=1 Tax=Rheinheimera soli TaxID=443616 RepID=A0ABU1VWG8_9GAMM|nr:S8 family serine peptidase [Rheinheimera soli]MDR7120081.1 hypothetical protein [Rheinheimera soli]